MAKLHTPISELPVDILLSLEASLNKDNLWWKIVSVDSSSPYHLSSEEIDKCNQSDENAGKFVLKKWGIRGQTVHSFLNRLQDLSRTIGSETDLLQLILNRKFKAVRWSRPEEIKVTVVNEGREIRLDCKAIGFPFPKFIWQKNQENAVENNGPTLIIPRTSLIEVHQKMGFEKQKPRASIRENTADAQYRCFVSNEVPDGYSFSSSYRSLNKQYSSSMISKDFDTSPFIGGAKCAKCQTKQLEQHRIICDDFAKLDASEASVRVEEVSENALVAVDKVALIISNCVYTHLPELVTPLCDAETLAEALQTMDYKTVTLADLTLEEMRFVVRQFKELLGHAVFYFVGHGFEVNGQCYLLPVDAPLEAHNPKHCISMDWFLAELSPHKSSLNLILLDMCRRFIPYDCIPAFVEYADQFKRQNAVNRNTVYGYSTSGGVGAYEVRGQVNGVFMTYLKEHITKKCSVIEMINKVLTDIGEDSRVSNVQVPELRTTLSKPRSLRDPLVYKGHTISFTHHTFHWEKMHELPLPVLLKFPDLKLMVTIWFRFCGHFTNKVYVLTSVGDMLDTEEIDDYDVPVSEYAQKHLAHLSFPKEVETSSERVLEDEEEGISWQVLLSHLQRSPGELKCEVSLKRREDEVIVGQMNCNLGHLLITRIVTERREL